MSPSGILCTGEGLFLCVAPFIVINATEYMNTGYTVQLRTYVSLPTRFLTQGNRTLYLAHMHVPNYLVRAVGQYPYSWNKTMLPNT